MSERNHSHVTDGTDSTQVPITEATGGFHPSAIAAQRKKRTRMILGGAVAAVMIGGILFQFFRAEEGGAGSDASGNTGQRTSQRDGSTVLGTVNGYSITWNAVAQECMERYGRDVLENLINRAVIQQACASRKVVVTNAEVSNEVSRIAKKFGISVENWYQMLQAERGITRLQYHRDIIWPMLALKKMASAKIEVTEKELREGMLGNYGPRVKAKLIMLDNQRRATEIHAKLVRNPEDFERHAQKYSIEPNSRALGGEIPPIRRYGGNPKIEEVAFKLQAGEISQVIPLGRNRFVILKCTGYTKSITTDLNTVRQELYKQIKEDKLQAAVARTFEKIRRETTINNFLTNQRTGIRQTSGTKDAGSARIRSPYPKAATRKSQTFR